LITIKSIGDDDDDDDDDGVPISGTSVCVYRSKELRKHQYFCFPNWTGGLYVTPTIAGSRPGELREKQRWLWISF